jgi:hypothetical protein
MRLVRMFTGLVCVAMATAAVTAPELQAAENTGDLQTVSTATAQIDLARLMMAPSISWQELTQSTPARLVRASWSRTIMPELADQIAPDGTRYLQLPVVRIYDANGHRLKLRGDVTNPQVSAARLTEALTRMEIDEEAPSLVEELALLNIEGRTDFDANDLPQGQAYVIDYGADWCRTSGPFHAALADWHGQAQAQGVVVIKADADFGQTVTAAR